MSKKAMDAPTGGSVFNCTQEQLYLATDEGEVLFSHRALAAPPEWLVESIMKKGIRQPIEVVKAIVDDQKIFKIVAGRNRYLAGCEANRRLAEQGLSLIRFPCLPMQGKSLEKNSLECVERMIEENELRQDNDPMERAELMSRLVHNFGQSHDEVGEKFRVSAQTVKKHLDLLELESEVQEAIRSRRVPVTFGYDMVVRGLDRKEQLEELAKILENAPELAPGQEPPKKTARKTSSTGTGRGFKAPSSKIVAHFRENLEEKITKIGQLETGDVVALIGWITGGIDEAEATKKAPILLELIQAAKDSKTEVRKENKARRDAKNGKAPKAPKGEGKKRGRPAKDTTSKPKIEKYDVKPFSKAKEKVAASK